mmetsp:Transcript_87847/g.170213  ORF Transcript_87847/g.170213 Transcript_87847/m.170213 type:complete len:152 (+) Transcript_87847:346-801(+)
MCLRACVGSSHSSQLGHSKILFPHVKHVDVGGRGRPLYNFPSFDSMAPGRQSWPVRAITGGRKRVGELVGLLTRWGCRLLMGLPFVPPPSSPSARKRLLVRSGIGLVAAMVVALDRRVFLLSVPPPPPLRVKRRDGSLRWAAAAFFLSGPA